MYGMTPHLNAVFHAEATLLMRMARRRGGTLAGEDLTAHADRAMCRSCQKMLPLIGLELGNPTVTFVGPLGTVGTIHDGEWLTESPGLPRRKKAYFDTYWEDNWPKLDWLEPYFLAPPGGRWFNSGGNDTAGLTIEGVEGSGHLGRFGGRIDVDLDMWGIPELGVLLAYSRSGDGLGSCRYTVSDLWRLKELARNLHGDPLPVGLFIPFEDAWKAVKEFIETEGALPKSIEWIESERLPPETFPTP